MERNCFPFNLVDHEMHVGLFPGSFATNSTSSPVAASNKGKGWSVVRTSQGLFTLTWNNPILRVNAIIPMLRLATPAARFVQLGNIDASAKTIQIRLLDNSGGVQDAAADANNRISFLAAISGPDNVNLQNMWHLGKNRLMIMGSFGLNNTSNPTLASHYGKGFTATRTGTGEHTLTFDTIFNQLEAFIPALQLDAAADRYAVGGAVSASAGSAVVTTYDISGGNGVDVASDANRRIHFLAIGRLTDQEA
jgi:hypothetical protein